MKASDYIARFLAAQGVTQVYELIGGMITHLIDSIAKEPGIQIVSMHHEQAAAFAAEAGARLTGVPGVALATSGPGATNLLTGIGSCFFDSTPAVFITGQVNRNELKRDRLVRQLGFQETDIVSMARPITKAAWLVEDANELPRLLEEAFWLAQSGRPGPVLLDIPMDVQRQAVDAPAPARVVFQPEQTIPGEFLQTLLEDLGKARRPLILAGGGIRAARAANEFRQLVDTLGVSVVTSLMGVDALPYAHPLRVGFIGSYGNRWGNLALGNADFLLVLGSRLDIRQTGADTDSFRSGKIIYHVDAEAGEINNRVMGCIPVHSQLRPFLQGLEAAARTARLPEPAAWSEEIARLRAQWSDEKELDGIVGINPNTFFHRLSAASGAAAAYVVDVGQHQMWAAQSIEVGPGQEFMTSGGMGAMGFSLPAGIGAAFARRGQPVVVVTGDGSMQVNLQELQTVARNQLPVKIVIMNNASLGMVRQFQESYFDSRFQSTCWGYSAPDFTRVANAFGIPALAVSDPAAVPQALEKMWADPAMPFILDVHIDVGTNVYPKIAFGHPITEMEPFVKPLDMEGT